MKLIISFLFTAFAISVNSQSFYDLNTIQTIEITFAESNWDQLLDAEKASTEDYIMAQSVNINGIVFDSVGVKYKGNSTYNANQTKNPFHIELDTYKDHIYEGYTDIKLSNAAKDPSFIREVLSYQILRQYTDAPLSNYANVYVNGNLIGLYSNSEAVSKKFLSSRFNSKKNTFIKCNPIDGAGPQSNDLPNLVYLGQDSTDYYPAYELKSDYGWTELINLCDTLKNNVSVIEEILDVDRTLWMLAFDNALVNLDSYIGAFAQNYYLYKDDYGRFLPVVWDLNESFGGFSMTGSGNLNSTSAKQRMSHLLNINDSDFPLVQQLLNIPTYKRKYLAHLKTMLLENFDDGSYYETGQALQNTIKDAVLADINKFYSYNNFISNLTSDINSGGGPGGGSTVGITNLMDGRNSYLLGLTDFTNIEPEISNIQLSSVEPIINEELTITASVSNSNFVYLGIRSQVGAPFQKLQMYDDGSHNDGSANDGIYGTQMIIDAAESQYYIYAENDNIGMFSPRRAEYEFYNIEAMLPNTTVGDVVINEFLASNSEVMVDQDGEFDDWIELYNNTSSSIDLSGYFLTDDENDLTQWTFPSGTTIEANSYIIVWADNDEEQNGLHANFKLSASGETIVLSDSSEELVDAITYLSQETDISYGRFPNGTGVFQSMEPTFNAENKIGTSSSHDIEGGNILIYPNPVNNTLIISNTTIEELRYTLYNGVGSILNSGIVENNIDVSNLNEGLYLLIIENSDKTISITEKIIKL